MIIVADSGSTKTDWALVRPGKTRFLQGAGLNPYFLTEEQIHDELKIVLGSVHKDEVSEISFFGAGTVSEVNRKKLKAAFARLFPGVKKIVIDSDLAGAARALFGKEKGIACILGTGANSCVYNGEKIVKKVRSLGYFLGDNGSGAVIGLRFLQLYLRNKLPEALVSHFKKEYNLDFRYIMDNVYRKPTPGSFFARFSGFVLKHIDEPVVKDMVIGEFREFVEYFILSYDEHKELPVRIAGSVGFHYREILDEVFAGYGLRIDKVIKKPIVELAEYYSAFV
jgi:N-acetylglucosamine kinase-like BadF-type ATPase